MIFSLKGPGESVQMSCFSNHHCQNLILIFSWIFLQYLLPVCLHQMKVSFLLLCMAYLCFEHDGWYLSLMSLAFLNYFWHLVVVWPFFALWYVPNLLGSCSLCLVFLHFLVSMALLHSLHWIQACWQSEACNLLLCDVSETDIIFTGSCIREILNEYNEQVIVNSVVAHSLGLFCF